MGVRVAVNGLGRIGRHVLRCARSHSNIEIVAVNDLISPPHLAYLLKYDSTHGRFIGEITVKKENLILDNQSIIVLSEPDPARLPWKDLGIDYVIEATGLFTRLESASRHLQAGAKRVILSAPAKDQMPTFVMGVNHTKYNPLTDRVVSNASCTTNCLAPLVKVLLDHCGIEEGLMTTVHAMTATQCVVDGPSKKNWRDGRGAHQNIIPASTGAAHAVGLCLPEVEGKLTGMAFRVPVADVSVVDLTVRVSQPTTYREICDKMREASIGSMQGILKYCEEEVVSSDFIGDSASSIFDVKAGIALNDKFFKLVAWYDNEIGYAYRLIDFVMHMASAE